ncbi:MAG TPA: hydroxysqualene dehydroxylase HpnE [Candidatus Sulfotelmatobacter sp.]|nr:hydroxysqualene dehydroxylase HpnE [Candidatus Sulfotelmatobacter sp.]
MTPSAKQPSVAVAGGGLAGLAAACALADAGFRVTLLERRPYLGGRASSYEHPGTGEIVDNCQHVLLGCCTNLIDFYRRTGAEEKIRWYDELVFLEPGGRASYIKPSFLPAPLHTGPSFLRAACLGWRDKLAIARAMMVLSGILGDEQADPFLVRQEGRLAPRDSGQSFLQWLEQHGQTELAIDRFWKTILVSALNEDLDRMSVPYAAQVVRESFLKSPAAGRMGVPTVPLTDLYNAAGNYIHEHGGELRVRCSLETFRADRDQIHVQVSSKDVGTSEEVFDYLVLALPFDGVDRVLPIVPEATPLREMLTHFESSPITGIHLWFDRQISELDHAVLLDRTIQWMFHKSRLQPMRTQGGKNSARDSDAPYSETNREGHESTRAASASSSDAASAAEVGSYVELVVSSSKSLIDRSRPEIIELALRELREFFPEAKAAQLVKSTVIKELHATYSPRPGIDAYRPGAATAWPRVFLAGDWTNTGWPATMEGAVRSGYMAAEALARASGAARSKFLMPDLPATGLMRLLT